MKQKGKTGSNIFPRGRKNKVLHEIMQVSLKQKQIPPDKQAIVIIQISAQTAPCHGKKQFRVFLAGLSFVYIVA